MASSRVKDSPFESLSARERQIMGLAAAGLVDKQIGQELEVSINTLRTYWSRIREKVGDSPRPALVAAYVAHTLSENSPDPLHPLSHEGWVMDAETRTILATDAINDDHGLERRVSHPASAYAKMTHPDDVARVQENVFAVAEGRLENVHLVFRMVTPRGIELVNSSVYGIKDASGRTRKVYGFRVSALDCRPGQDPTIRIGHWTRRYPEETITIDSTLAEIIGRPGVSRVPFGLLEEMIASDDVEAIERTIDEAVAEGRDRVEGDLRFVRPDGEVVWARITRLIVRNADGVTVHGTLIAFR